MTTPCRPTTCDHLQCFDAALFLMMNEKKPTWICPVCDSPAKYEDLMVDGYFEEVIKGTWCSRLNRVRGFTRENCSSINSG